jgi:hypothetical protein
MLVYSIVLDLNIQKQRINILGGVIEPEQEQEMLAGE